MFFKIDKVQFQKTLTSYIYYEKQKPH